MSYDIVETIVTTRKRVMQPASVVQLEGEIQFTKYTPLELAVSVDPKFVELQRYVGHLERCAKIIQDDFVLCGYYLNCIKREGLYRYCIDEGLQGYTNFYKFCQEVLGISTTSAKRMIAINEHFCSNGKLLPEAYKKYGSSKLAIMATFENGLEGKLTPQVSVRELDKLQKYYSSHEWQVERNTTWKEDLRKYEKEQEEKRLAKSTRLTDKKFQSAKDNKSENTVLITDNYKAYTRFFDETLRNAENLPVEDKRFVNIYKELTDILKRLQNEVLKLQSSDVMDGL